MALEKNNTLVTYPCGIMLSSITDDTVALVDAFAVSPSTIVFRTSTRRDEHGVRYNQVIEADFAGLDADTFALLDSYNRDDYKVQLKYDDGKIFTVATANNPMDFTARSRNGSSSIELSNTALELPKYEGTDVPAGGFPFALTFSLT